MSIDQFASALRDRRIVFLGTFVLCFALVVAVTIALPKSYRATSTLYVGDERLRRNIELNSDLGEQLTRTYSTLAANPNVADAVRRQLPLDLSRNELLDRMSFAPVERTQLLQISAEAGSSSEARLIANTYADVFTRRVARQFAAGRTQSRVRVNEAAALPSGAFRPNPPLYIGLGALLSLLLALAAALGRELLDRRIRIPEQAATVLGEPIVGRIPRVGAQQAYASPEVTDAVRLMKTTLDLAAERPAHVVAVTSAGAVEGKTSLSATLAVVSAADGERVVLIESDLRRPSLASALPIAGARRPEIGLTNYLVGAAGEDEILAPHPEFPNLTVVWSGPPPPNPSSLLRSERLADLLYSLRPRFDRIVIDTPPISVGADAAVIVSRADGVLYVIDVRETTEAEALLGLNQLRAVRANVLGTVLNGTAPRPGAAYQAPANRVDTSTHNHRPRVAEKGLDV